MAGDSGDISDVEKKIARQIEYYFGDVNLMRDRFLKEKIQEDDGWVTVETMLKFNRLRQLSEDAELIVKALKKSTAELMEVNEAGDKIRRNPSKPLPGDTKERREEISTRTIYAKCFPLEVTLDELMTYFETYGSVENIFMRRDFHKKTFKGSVFVTFAKQEDAEKFLKEEGTKYKEEALAVKLLKSDYFQQKNSERKRAHKPEAKPEVEEKKKKDEPVLSSKEKAQQQMTKNAVLYFEGIDAETSREDIKNFFGDFGSVGWVDFEKGDGKGYIRLREPNSAQPSLDKAKAAGDGKVLFNEKEIEVRVVEGEEELEYWIKMFDAIAEKHKNMKNFRGDRRGGGRFQRGGRRNRGGPQGKRRQEEDAEAGEGEEGEPAQKVAKKDDAPEKESADDAPDKGSAETPAE